MDARISGKFILTGEVIMQSDDPELLFERVLARRLQREIATEDCPDAGILAAFHEGTLSNDEILACRMHAAKCARCKSVIEALEVCDARLSPEQEYVPSADAATPEVLGYGVGDRRFVRLLQPFKGWLMPATVTVAAGILVLIGILVIRQIEKGAVQIAMNKPPIEKPEKRLSSGETARPATEIPSQPKAQRTIEEESGLKSKSIKNRRQPDTLDSDASLGAPLTIANEKVAEISQMEMSGPERLQRKALKKEIVGAVVSKDSEPVKTQAEAPPKHISVDIIDEFVVLSEIADKRLGLKEEKSKAVRDNESVDEFKIVFDGEDLHDAASDNKASRMDKERPIKAEKRKESAEIGRQFLVASPDTDVQWRFGAAGLIEKSIDGGKSWKRQSSNVTDDLLAGVVPAEKICWLAGKNGTVLLTTDGENWTRLHFPSKIDLGGIASQDAINALVWDTQNKVKFSTKDGGNTWTEATGTAPHAP
jgi:hypothetical protein